mgnify:CR=1 FL=1
MHFANPEGVGDGSFMTVEIPSGFGAFDRLDLLVLVIDTQVLAAAPVAQDVALREMCSHL